MEISPAQAQVWLDATCHQRPLAPSRVTRIADDIRSGRWDVNGETIIIASDGSVLDGQHRLRAVIVSGLPITSAVTLGGDPSSFASIDTGAARSAADVVAILGHKNAAKVASVAGGLLSLAFWHGRGFFSSPPSPTKSQIVALVQRDADSLSACASQVLALHSNGIGSSTIPIAVLEYIRRFGGRVDAFVASLTSGEDLSSGDPVLRLRTKLLLQKRGRGDADRWNTTAACIYAWNAHVHGATMMKFSIKTDEQGRLSFPRIFVSTNRVVDIDGKTTAVVYHR
jgi:hypothetical protein